jgi:hypothetical protein
MGIFLMDSLTDAEKACIQPYATEYTRHSTVVVLLLFKVIMRLGTIDSIATTKSLTQLLLIQSSINQRDFYGNRNNMHYMAYKADNAHKVTYKQTPDHLHAMHLTMQDSLGHPIAFHAQMPGDIMYLHQALQQPDAPEFVKAVIKEINGHVENNNWKLIPHSEGLPSNNVNVVPSVRAMHHKCDLTTTSLNSKQD